MATLVLAHARWDGGWAWQSIANLLRAAAHDVFALTLTGSSERIHLTSPNIALTTHNQDTFLTSFTTIGSAFSKKNIQQQVSLGIDNASTGILPSPKHVYKVTYSL